MSAASEVAITVAYHLTKSYGAQLNALVSAEDFDKTMSSLVLKAPPLKKRALVISKMVGYTGKEAITPESDWEDFFQRLLASVEDVDWGKLCGIGGKLIVNLATLLHVT